MQLIRNGIWLKYEGFLEVDESAITELCDLAGSLIAEVSKMLE